MQKITPCLWFDFQLEEALVFYKSVFPGLEVLQMNRYPDSTPEFAGKVLTAHFRMAGQDFFALNGGPMFKFTEAVSFSVACENQEEIDYYWNKLTEGGQESMCGWLKDKFGLSWQIVPSRLSDWIHHPDPEKANRAVQEMFTMRKLDIGVLKRATGE